MLDEKFQSIVKQYNMATIGAGIIEDGELVWTGYYGEQAPGVPASSETLFNVASITKTVTSELIVRLANEGVISLDEPMSDYWIDPDIAEDPRHRELTPRLALTHRTGFPNWRYLDEQFKLRFSFAPGTSYGYSGEGMEYAARFAEKKTGENFQTLVNERVLGPSGVKDISLAPRDWVIPRLALPVDSEGERKRPFCSGPDGGYCVPDGQWSAADEMVTTVEAYARFMIGVMNGEGVSDELQAERMTIQSSTAEDEVLACTLPDRTLCPSAQGYGLGWEIFEFEDAKLVSHGGGDWSERSMVYFNPETRDGIVLFINGPSTTNVEALMAGMNALDNRSKIAVLYRGWVDAYNQKNKS